MAHPVKVAKQMFDQFLSKHDPDPNPGFALDSAEPEDRAEARKLAAKGGRARAASLTPQKRKRIARRAAKARWSNSKD